jgi:hypothetical protein
MATVTIRVDASDTPNPQYQPASHGDKIVWKSTANPPRTFYIIFNSPFTENTIKNDNGNGETKPLTVRKALGYYPYVVSDAPDPSLATKAAVRPLTGGGGIIIQN